jgi:hypothetical protein
VASENRTPLRLRPEPGGSAKVTWRWLMSKNKSNEFKLKLDKQYQHKANESVLKMWSQYFSFFRNYVKWGCIIRFCLASDL